MKDKGGFQVREAKKKVKGSGQCKKRRIGEGESVK